MSEEIKKLRNGTQVAVLVSYGYGAGWYSWNSQNLQCLFDPDIIAAVVDGKKEEARRLAYEKWPDGYWGGSDGLDVVWLEEGTRFIINEYDGAERLETVDDLTITA